MTFSIDATVMQRMIVQEMKNAHVENQINYFFQNNKPVWRRFVDGFAWGSGMAIAFTPYKIASIANGTIKSGGAGAMVGAAGVLV
jgi:hypothetical protein